MYPIDILSSIPMNDNGLAFTGVDVVLQNIPESELCTIHLFCGSQTSELTKSNKVLYIGLF